MTVFGTCSDELDFFSCEVVPAFNGDDVFSSVHDRIRFELDAVDHHPAPVGEWDVLRQADNCYVPYRPAVSHLYRNSPPSTDEDIHRVCVLFDAPGDIVWFQKDEEMAQCVLLVKLDAQPNKARYIKELIRADIEGRVSWEGEK